MNFDAPEESSIIAPQPKQSSMSTFDDLLLQAQAFVPVAVLCKPKKKKSVAATSADAKHELFLCRPVKVVKAMFVTVLLHTPLIYFRNTFMFFNHF